jgi:hypothetical protein
MRSPTLQEGFCANAVEERVPVPVSGNPLTLSPYLITMMAVVGKESMK